MLSKNIVAEAGKRVKHHPWEIWKKTRGNYRAMGPLPKNKQRSFKTYKDAREWLQTIREKEKELYDLKLKGITPKTELRKVIGYIRRELSSEEQVNYETVLRKALDALSTIHVKMT